MERFEFVKKLGEGVYGVVWQAYDKESGGMVAVKCFKEARRDCDTLSLAQREARLLKAAAHPNVVQLREPARGNAPASSRAAPTASTSSPRAYSVPSRQRSHSQHRSAAEPPDPSLLHRGSVFLVTEFVDHTLLDHLGRHRAADPAAGSSGGGGGGKGAGGLPEASAKLIMWQVLQATAYLHMSRIIHRDLTPSNILVSSDGIVKLCDFGFARTVAPTDTARYTTYVTTRWYRSPELLVGAPYGTGADVWAIGCLFAEMVSGVPLFPGTSVLDQLSLISRALGPLPPWQLHSLSSRNEGPGRRGTAGGLVGGNAPLRLQMPEDAHSLEARFPTLAQPMMAVLRGCLHPDPAHRLSAKELLSLPYFDDIFEHTRGTELQRVYDTAYSTALYRGSPAAPCLWACSSSCLEARAFNVSLMSEGGEAGEAGMTGQGATSTGEAPVAGHVVAARSQGSQAGEAAGLPGEGTAEPGGEGGVAVGEGMGGAGVRDAVAGTSSDAVEAETGALEVASRLNGMAAEHGKDAGPVPPLAGDGPAGEGVVAGHGEGNAAATGLLQPPLHAHLRMGGLSRAVAACAPVAVAAARRPHVQSSDCSSDSEPRRAQGATGMDATMEPASRASSTHSHRSAMDAMMGSLALGNGSGAGGSTGAAVAVGPSGPGHRRDMLLAAGASNNTNLGGGLFKRGSETGSKRASEGMQNGEASAPQVIRPAKRVYPYPQASSLPIHAGGGIGGLGDPSPAGGSVLAGASPSSSTGGGAAAQGPGQWDTLLLGAPGSDSGLRIGSLGRHQGPGSGGVPARPINRR